MFTTVKYTLLTAVRDWLFVGIIASLAGAFALSSFLGGTALVEENHMRISFAAASSRIVLLVGLIVFTCFHVRNAFANKEIDLILSRPISRATFVFAYWLGLILISLILCIALTGALFCMNEINTEGLLYWGASLFMETTLVIAFSLFSSLILRSAVTSVLLCFGFYIISRMMGFFLFIIDSPMHKHSQMGVDMVIEKSILFISAILPRLDLFAKSTWITYGIDGDISYYIFVPQTIIYASLLIIMAIYDLKRKQF